MRLRQIYEDGRIVKGVNTTADVGPNEIKIQAAKFGNSVDKDGRPPTLSKKVKGAKTNVLFNLGLAESRNFAEALGEIANTTHIYVDMDGVLADFFTEWGKLMGKDNWRDIGLEQIPAALEKIRQTENFWLDLPLTKNAKNLLNLIKDVKGEYSICSSPLPGDPNSEPHKLEWIKKHLNFFPPKDVIITHDKTKYAVQKDGTPNILIDDYGKNINAWEAAGGVGFKHKDHKFERTAKDIKQHMQEPVEENITEALDNPYQYKLTGPNTDNTYFAKAQTPNGELVMEFDGGYDDFSIDFAVANQMGKTEAGDEFRVFATVVAMMNEWIDVVGIEHVESFDFGANKDEHASDGRAKLYTRFAKKLASKLGWSLQQSSAGNDSTEFFSLINPKAIPRPEGYFDAIEDGKLGPNGEIPAEYNESILESPLVAWPAVAYALTKIPPNTYAGAATAIGTAIAKAIKHLEELIKKNPKHPKVSKIKAALAWLMITKAQGQKSIEENFADGKKKGKSKPGRVKRSGASCNGTITQLRKRAKNASGEKAKMYHWCANMKSGRKKKK